MSLPALAAVDDLFLWLQTDSTDVTLRQGGLYLQMASGLVRDYLQQDITAGFTTVTAPVLDDGCVYLDQAPVTALTSVVDVSTTLALDPTLYVLDSRGGSVAMVPDGNLYTPAAVTLTYSHGYPEVPDGIKAVVIASAARAFATPAGVQSEALGGWSVHYQKGITELTPEEKATLDRYRWVVIA